MKQDELGGLAFNELRDRLALRRDGLERADHIDLTEALRRLTTLPDQAHTPDSVDALIQLARNFFFEGHPAEALQAASLASRLAVALEQELMLCHARGAEGLALSDLGRFTESTIAHADSWRLARALGDVEKEISATKRVGGLYSAMAQFDVAFIYFSRSRELAAAHGFPDLELESRNNIANCCLQLGDPVSGLRALLPFEPNAPKTRLETLSHANAHDTLAHLYLMTGETTKARKHALESGRLAELAGVKRTTQRNEALLGLIDVKSGIVEKGLSAVEGALAFAKRVDHIDVVDYLVMCVDAHEAAGQPERALAYLQELVAWKKESIDSVVPPHYEVITEPAQFQARATAFDDSLVLRSQFLQAGVQQRIQHLIEMAINAEIASGHDLYRTFRVGKLAYRLATAIGWDEERIRCLALGGQLCNIGMTAVPTRILQKPRGLSDSERNVMHAHTQYGAELLRKSRVRSLEVASIVAEQHHEHYDGTGYPLGLAGEAISQEARIVAVCDAFDAMTHRRPWRAAPLSIQAALNELKRRAGSQFDPSVVTVFVDLVRREFWEHEDFDAFLAEGADELGYVRARARMDAFIVSR